MYISIQSKQKLLLISEEAIFGELSLKNCIFYFCPINFLYHIKQFLGICEQLQIYSEQNNNNYLKPNS